MGRNMFGPIRGPWPDDSWKGWWGDSPPYHTPVFVLAHHARSPITMQGGTVFRFVTGGIHVALQEAADAAGGQDVRLGGGVSTLRQYLRAGLVDEMHTAIAPVLLGSGEHLFANIDLLGLGYRCTEHVLAGQATHVVLTRRCWLGRAATGRGSVASTTFDENASRRAGPTTRSGLAAVQPFGSHRLPPDPKSPSATNPWLEVLQNGS